jgi:hypothetical protein
LVSDEQPRARARLVSVMTGMAPMPTSAAVVEALSSGEEVAGPLPAARIRPPMVLPGDYPTLRTTQLKLIALKFAASSRSMAACSRNAARE